MLDRKSIYALNKKDQEAIVYMDADRNIIRLTREDFDTEADFLKWKAWSDENYHDQEKRDHVHANHTFSMADIPYAVGATDGPEVVIEQRIEKQARERYSEETVIRIRGQLTEKQFRRIWKHCVEGMTEQEIAAAEHTSQSKISESITPGLKKIKRIFRVRQISPDIRTGIKAMGEGQTFRKFFTEH